MSARGGNEDPTLSCELGSELNTEENGRRHLLQRMADLRGYLTLAMRVDAPTPIGKVKIDWRRGLNPVSPAGSYDASLTRRMRR